MEAEIWTSLIAGLQTNVCKNIENLLIENKHSQKERDSMKEEACELMKDNAHQERRLLEMDGQQKDCVAEMHKREEEWNVEMELIHLCYEEELWGPKIRMHKIYKEMQHIKLWSPKKKPSPEVVKTQPVKVIAKNEKEVLLKGASELAPSEKPKSVTLEEAKPAPLKEPIPATPEKTTTCTQPESHTRSEVEPDLKSSGIVCHSWAIFQATGPMKADLDNADFKVLKMVYCLIPNTQDRW